MTTDLHSQTQTEQTELEELYAHFGDVACQCEHTLDQGLQPCGGTAVARVTSPCSEPGCDRAGRVELLCSTCAGDRVAYFGADRVTVRPLR